MTSAGAPPSRLAPRSDWLRGGSAPSQGAGPRRLQSGEGHGGRRRAPPLRVQPAALGPAASATAAAYRLPPAAAHSPSPAPGAMEGMSALLARYPTAGLAGGLGVTACAAAGVLLYRIARRMKPTHTVVNCWFCNQDTVVPYGNRNCWDCPHCEQYNGFQENGDYNKPIPAQYLEHLNHVVSGAPGPRAPMQPPQWVSSQVLLCRRCSHHQTTKIKQLAAFSPRDEGRYDEEIEVYRHHLEQMYKLCRPCQAAVEHYIKHQNRQLRALLLSHQFRRREADQTHAQSFCSSVVKAPLQVIVLRALAFLACAFLLTTALYGTSNPFAPGAPLPPALPPGSNGSAPPDNSTAPGTEGWRQLLGLLPKHAAEKLHEAWAFGQSHQMGVVGLGLLTCLLAMLLAGRLRLRRIDAFSTGLWALLLALHLAEQYLQAASPSWLDTLKFSTTSLCCLVGFTAAVATRKATGPRRFRPRRYFPGDSAGLFPAGHSLAVPCRSVAGPSPALFIPAPPGFLPLANQQLFRSPRRASPSSLPGRLSRALSLGTIPSLTRAGSSVTTLLTLGSHPVPTGFASPSGCGLGCGAVRQDPASRKVGGILVKPGLLTCSVSLKPLSSSPKQGPPPPVRHPSGPVSLRDPPSVCCVQSSVLVGRGWATVQETRLAGHSS
ncbi:transmembrane protein 201 isoform X3 [Neophocaena asiaeorientalis asiaeorientalis]|uniref:Transmembrane protein 201 isoform X3 n=1 Tax=Neophocaena asiaeorientalis asiaeorientalis TaxID=1706337 RepID=A0A341BRZ1_NEOAA|nr:transmembrane protein 201 isoform X3 [Neophocaena asiaeorientalis asiaeorientalis]